MAAAIEAMGPLQQIMQVVMVAVLLVVQELLTSKIMQLIKLQVELLVLGLVHVIMLLVTD